MQNENRIRASFIGSLFVLFLVFVTGVNAQRSTSTPGYIFTTYTASDGLASAEILTLATDNKGFLWAGTTAGISCYDGYTFTNYAWSAGHDFIGTVNVIRCDTTGRLWIGASSGLYSYWQKKLVKISADTTTLRGVNDILCESDGSLWLATEQGPAFIPAQKTDLRYAGTIRLAGFVLPQWNQKFVPVYGTACLFIKKAADGTLFFAQQYSLFQYSRNLISFLHQTKQENDKIEWLMPVSNNKVFYNAAVTGLNKVQDGVHTGLRFKELYQPGRKSSGPGVWFTGSLGIVCFYPEEEFIGETVDYKDKSISWLSGILKQDQLFWLATHNGLIKIKRGSFNRYETERYNNIHETFSFAELKTGAFIAGANHGEMYQIRSDGAFPFLPGAARAVPNAEVKALYEDQRGWLWIGSGYQGLSLWRNGKLTRFTTETHSLHDNSFSSFLAAKNGRLFAIGDKGMTEIQVNEQNLISFKPYYARPAFTTYAKYYRAAETPRGTILIGGEEGLRMLRNDSLLPVQVAGLDRPVRGISTSSDGLIWLATAGNGILCCRINPADQVEVMQQYDETNGLPAGQFLNLFIDKDDDVWAGSIKGLTLIGRSGNYKNRILNFTAADGFIQPGFYSCHFFQDRDGLIWMGTSGGIASFRKEDILSAHTASPEVYLTGIDLLKEPGIQFNTDSLMMANSRSLLSLPYYSNALSFSYTAVYFPDPGSVRYFYRLEGLDTAWIAAGNRRTMSFYNLTPGHYTFSIKAVHEKGGEPYKITSFSFIIRPPFWKTIWFRIVVLLLGLTGIWLLLKWREKSIARREAQKTEMEKLKRINLQNQLEIEQVTGYFAASIGNHSTTEEMLWDVAGNLIGKLGFEDCMIYLWNADRTVLLQKAGYGSKGAMQDAMDKEKYNIVKGRGIVGAAVQAGKALLVNDTTTDPRYFSVDGEIRLSELCVPVIHEGEVMGAINTEHREKGFYTPRHLQILTTIASILANKIHMLEAQQTAREKEMEVLQLNKDLSDWQVSALRAQMNPHFIFNALNSIQQFTLSQDADNANHYLSKFSTLLRKVLTSSQKNMITLEEEAEQLRLYLEIEQLRLGEEFTHTISFSEEIEPDAIRIPGMLIQPFVENAVKHGLAAKTGKRELTISFELSGEDWLLARITDNGVGRKQAADAKKISGRLLPHVSNGIRLVQERLRLLGNVTAARDYVEITDLYTKDGLPAGTSVCVQIPLAAGV